MCSSKSKTCPAVDIAQINGRPVLQPGGNRVPSLERRNSLKKVSPKSPPTNATNITSTVATAPTQTLSRSLSTASIPRNNRTSILSPPISPKSKSPRPPAIKRGNDPNGLNSSADKTVLTPRASPKLATLERKKSKNNTSNGAVAAAAAAADSPSTIAEASTVNYSSLIVEAPGSIAAARREQVTLLQAQRKMRIAHYGRTKSGKLDQKIVPLNSSSTSPTSINSTNTGKDKRCSFITPNSDPLYVAYHDEEWGVPVHDDKLLFELLVLSGAQVGSDWTSILKKRQDFKDAFSGFDPELVAQFTEKQITSISADYGIDLSRVRGTVDNAKRILEIKKALGSLDNYLWGFVNHKPISTQYKSCHKIPVKTSKSESISKDMVRRGFRFVGPTVMHSFMQAAGLTNDHLITCPQHLQCIALASYQPSVAPSL